MEVLNSKMLAFVAGGDGECPPPRDTDVVDCAQSEYGNIVNDAASLAANAYEAAVSATTDAMEAVAGWFD